MSDSSRPHGLQPSRLLHSWDFPGKSTGVGCHCLLCNPSQVTNSIFQTIRTNNFPICMEIQKTSNSQSNPEKEWNWRNQPAWLQALLQSYSHQDSMVLAQRQKYRSIYLLFNMLSRLVIAFLRRSKCLLISWLQSPSAVILEPPKIVSFFSKWLTSFPSTTH